LVMELHHYGGTWVFYVIAPIILCGAVACLWWIVRGAIGVFGQTPQEDHRMRRPEAVRAAPFHQVAGISTMPVSVLGRGQPGRSGTYADYVAAPTSGTRSHRKRR
jgi:hypothetical protein